MIARIAALIVVGTTLVPPARAVAQGAGDDRAGAPADESIEALRQRALVHYRAGQYADAARAFAALYEREARNEFLYAWAQSERQAGRCEAAAPLYAQFLARDPHGENAEAARLNLARCRDTLPPPQALAAPKPAEPPVVHTRTVVEVRPAARVWYRDPWAGALAGAGLVGLAAAGGFELASREAADDARDAATYDVFAARGEDGEVWRDLASVSLVVGSCALIAAAARWAWLAF